MTMWRLSFGARPGQPVVWLAALLALFAVAGVGLVRLASDRAQAELQRQALLRAEQRAAQLADAQAGRVQACWPASTLPCCSCDATGMATRRPSTPSRAA
jgi:hypothetical protein